MKRRVWIVLALVVVVSGAYFGDRRGNAASVSTASKTQTALVSRGDLQATVSSSGSLRAAKSSTLSFGATGTVISVTVSTGQTVKAGDVLASLDDTSLAAQVTNAEMALKVAELKLEDLKAPPTDVEIQAAKAAVDSAQAAYAAAAAKAGTVGDQLDLAKQTLDKAAKTVQDAQAAYDAVSWRPNIGAMPQSAALQAATVAFETAKVSYRITVAGIQETPLTSAASAVGQAQDALTKLLAGASELDLASAELSVDQAKTSLASAEANLENASIVAPFDGTVTSVSASVGDSVGAGTAVIGIADLAHLQIAASFAEVDIVKVKAGQAVNVSLDALSGVALTGKVSDVALVGTVTQGVVNYTVTIALDPTKAAARPGMSASLTIVVDERKNVLLVPNRAVRTATGTRTKYVDVMVEGQTVQVPVTIGLASGSVTEVTGDQLHEGDTVVIATTTTTSSSGRGSSIGVLGGVVGGGGPPVP
jgi:HlyD family secretion protein